MFIKPSFVYKKNYRRIISLVPSQTELLYHLGLENEVVGITKFCVHPQQWFKSKTKVGGTKNVNIALIKKIAPALIIANNEENVQEQIEELSKDTDVYVTDIKTLEDAVGMIKNIGTLTGTMNAAAKIAIDIEQKFYALQQSFFTKPTIKTAYLVWKDPYMTAGGDTFINNMMKCCGLENVFENSARYPVINNNDLSTAFASNAGQGLILLSSEPYPFKEKHIGALRLQMPFATILLADGEMFSWYGSRLLQSAGYFKKLRIEIEILFTKRDAK